jgi:hypothetical protein
LIDAQKWECSLPKGWGLGFYRKEKERGREERERKRGKGG